MKSIDQQKWEDTFESIQIELNNILDNISLKQASHVFSQKIDWCSDLIHYDNGRPVYQLKIFSFKVEKSFQN